MYLSCWWQVAVDIVDLFFESSVQHLVSLVQNEQLDISRSQVASSNHVECTTRCTDDYMLTKVKFADILANVGATNADVSLDVHVVTQSENDFLDLLRQFTSRTENQG